MVTNRQNLHQKEGIGGFLVGKFPLLIIVQEVIYYKKEITLTLRVNVRLESPLTRFKEEL